MGNQWSLMLLILLSGFIIICRANSRVESDAAKSRVINVNGGSTEESSVVWVVQLSDLHFSVHHPDRALDFSRQVGPALSLINPSLVLITGDLTDGKSLDLLTMKQNEKEWVEYQSVIEEVVQRSGLDKSIFYDLRGNHDNFGVPSIGDSLDFFSKYSVSGQQGRNSTVNSVTVETHSRKHLFVGLDTTMPVGVRGPTNLFGHPSDELLHELDSQLLQWDNPSPAKPVTKLSFGHFPLSFSAPTSSRKSLKDIFLKHSVSAYLCGHLHTRFGKNLKRLHQSVHHHPHKFFQLNIKPSFSAANCSYGAPQPEEFWEWEMGDWRKSRAMRILAIDSGHVSYIDIDFKTGPKNTIILPTFPLDSRFMSKSCPDTTVRTLVFSTSTIVSVIARVFDARGVNFRLVEELHMTKQLGNSYSAPWNHKAFEDPSPDRFWLQIEATDATGRISFTELRPFSVNGLSAGVIWTWKEFLVMGCQWASLYGPMLWCAVFSVFSILAIPKVLSMYMNKQHGFFRAAWILQGLCEISVVWFGFWGYLFYLLLFPWFVGKVFTDGGRGYMTYKGWVVNRSTAEFVGYPDIMVIVVPHLVFVVLPSVLVGLALAGENKCYLEHVQSTLRKKEDDYHGDGKRSPLLVGVGNCRRIRKLLLVVCLIICWKHFKNCRDLVKAYEMNPIFHSPVYCFWIPLLLGYVVYATNTKTIR